MSTSSGQSFCSSSTVSRRRSGHSSATLHLPRKLRIATRSRTRFATSCSGWPHETKLIYETNYYSAIVQSMVPPKRICVLVFLAVAASFAATSLRELLPAEQAALDRISPDSLRTNLSFLASADREARMPPPRALARAAEYTAAQSRRPGLEPAAADRSYFQVAKFDQ